MTEEWREQIVGRADHSLTSVFVEGGLFGAAGVGTLVAVAFEHWALLAFSLVCATYAYVHSMRVFSKHAIVEVER